MGRFLLVGGAWVSMAQAAQTGFAILTQMLLARLLAPEALGAFFLTQSVVMVGAQLGTLGTPRPLTRIVAQAQGADRPGRGHAALRAAVAVTLSTGLLVAAVYALGLGAWIATAAFASAAMAAASPIASLWILGMVLQAVLAAALRGLRRVGQAAFLGGTLSHLLMASALAVYFWKGGTNELSQALGVAVLAVWIAVAAMFVALRGEWFGPGRESGMAEMLLRSALPLVPVAVVHVALTRADLWVAGALFTANDVALYGAAKRLILVVSFPLLMLTLVVPPVIADLYAKGELDRLQRSLRGAATLAGLPAIGLLLLLSLGSSSVLGLTFGEFYRGAAPILVLLCVERLVFVWVGPCTLTLLMAGHEGSVMRITTSLGVLTVLAVYVGGVLLGLHGVALGFVAGSVLHQLLMWNAARVRVRVRTDLDLLHLREALEAVRRALETKERQ